MDPIMVGIIGLVVFLILVMVGMWVGYAAALVGLIGITFLKGWGAAGGVAGFLPFSVTASFEFSVIPMFIIMGYFAFYGGITRDIFYTTRQWMGHLHGGLAIATTYGCALFGAISGSSTAAAAIMGKVTIPEMQRYNYDNKLASGTVAAGGTLASMIPPSVVMVIYGVIAEASIGKIMIAGIIPGIIEATLFAILIYGWCRLNPKAGPALPPASWKERLVSLKGIWSTVLLAGLVLGGLYAGVFTPTEAGGIGATGALLIAVGTRSMSWDGFKKSILDTGKTTAMIFTILIGILVLLRFFALSGMTPALIKWVLGMNLPPLGLMIGIIAIYTFLGMFVSATGMVMLTVPFFLPVVTSLGYDPIWFGIIVVKMCEVAFITPPVAMNLYAVKAVAPDIPMDDLVKGIIPFIVMDFVSLAFFIAFPQIILWLPGTMTQR
ncbi:MAG: TRAP transporter large permease [Chloroflexota bacterium]